MWNLKDHLPTDASVFRQQFEQQWDNSPALHAPSEVDPNETQPWAIIGENSRRTIQVLEIEFGGYLSADRKWMMLPTGEMRLLGSNPETLLGINPRRIGTLFLLMLNPYQRLAMPLRRAQDIASSRGIVTRFLTPTRA